MTNENTSGETSVAVLAHILGLFTGIIAPLIIVLITKDEYTKKNAKIALNWQISFLLYVIISFLLMFILIGFVLIVVVAILDIVFCIKAAIKAGENIVWKYPLAIPFLRV